MKNVNSAVFKKSLIIVLIFICSLYCSEPCLANNFTFGEKSFLKKNKEDALRILWFTDQQYYSRKYPTIYDFLGDWFVQEYKRGSFDYIINTGDIVDNAYDKFQWNVADRNFYKLDQANIPYGVLAGNHDISYNGYVTFSKHFGVARFLNKPWFGGSMDNNRNHYDLVSSETHDFIILYIGYKRDLDQETVIWANAILNIFCNRIAILAFHEYLNADGTLTKTAQKVFDNIITKNDNVVMVLCGHNHGAAHNIKTVVNSDGSIRKVLEMLADYQMAPNGGNGFLRFLTYYPASGKLKVNTYSPNKKTNHYFDKDEDNFKVRVGRGR